MPKTEIRTISRPFCPLCGGEGSTLYPDMKDRLFAVPGNWPLKQCSNPDCGLSWLGPAPHEADIPLLYTTYFTHEQKKLKQRLLARLRSFLYRGYMAVSYVPSTFLGVRKARRQMLHMFLHDLNPGKLLDVGCGDGTLLHRMHNLGWSATGVDFDAKAIENAKARYGSKVTVLHSNLFNARFPDVFFDAVTMSHVIEHVPDPVALLIEARRILKVGGRLVITTPNIRSYGHEKFRDCWWGLDSPRHLQIFSLQALQKCARKAGFDAVKTGTSAANADTFIGGSFGFKEAKLNGDCSSGNRIQFNFVRGLHSLLFQYRESFLLRHNPECGEEAILICEK
jgi:2-polyprenyl-3-methyl-5-hydroxy-6-metoxy-1,4-benzoquinol methylase